MLTLPTRMLAASRPLLGDYHDRHPYADCIPALATMHSKERAVAPAFRRHLNLPILVCDFIDTDAFGTFTGELPRHGTALDAATEKAKLACAKTGRRLGIGSEGSFGPHPLYPFIVCDNEVIVLYDRELDIRIVESVTSPRTNFRHLDTDRADEIEGFLQSVGAPSHAVVVGSAGRWGRGLLLKGLTNVADVRKAIREVKLFEPGDRIRIATDMRAHLNPTRMAVIRSAASKLAQRIANMCRECAPRSRVRGGAQCLVCLHDRSSATK